MGSAARWRTRALFPPLAMLLLGACLQSTQFVAQHVDADAATSDASDRDDTLGGHGDGGACPWEVEALPHELPIRSTQVGKAVDFRVAFDAQQREFALIFKPQEDQLSTRVSFQRFDDEGRAIGGVLELQPELAPVAPGALWSHSLLGVVRIGEAWVALWSQMGYLKSAEGYDFIESGIYARRILDGVADGRQTLDSGVAAYLRAHDLSWTGSQLAIASVETKRGLGPQAGFPKDPRVVFRRFDSALDPLGGIAIPQAGPWGLSIMDLRLSGDDQRLGVFLIGEPPGTAQIHGVFALIVDGQVSAVSPSPEPVSFSWGVAQASLGFAAGNFLCCTTLTPRCLLRDGDNGTALGNSIAFFTPGIEPPRAVASSGGRFWVAASASADGPLQRVLGWVKADSGESGQQVLWSAPDLTLFDEGPAVTTALFAASADELFWIDNIGTYQGDQSVLWRLTRTCH